MHPAGHTCTWKLLTALPPCLPFSCVVQWGLDSSIQRWRVLQGAWEQAGKEDLSTDASTALGLVGRAGQQFEGRGTDVGVERVTGVARVWSVVEDVIWASEWKFRGQRRQQPGSSLLTCSLPFLTSTLTLLPMPCFSYPLSPPFLPPYSAAAWLL